MKSIFNFLLFIFSISVLSINSSVYAQQWVSAGTVPNPGLTPSISVYNGDVVWIAGGAPNAPKIFQTENGGTTWNTISTNGTSNELFCIWAISPTVAIAGEGAINSYAKLYKFSVNELQWNVVLQTGMNDGGFNNLIFSRNNPLVGGALADELYLTTNGGNSWVQKVTGVTGVSSAQNSLMLVDQTFFGFGLKNGASRVRMTIDGGNTWSTKSINLTGSYTSGFTFKDDKLTGISSTASSMPNIARTTDGGTTWNTIDIGSGLTGNTLIKWIPGTNLVYILGANGAVKRSTNNGLNWTTMNTTGMSGLTHFDFNKVNNIICGYAISSTGNVFKLADSILVLTNLNNNETGIPTEFKLSQNYPNPFNPSTSIKYALPKNSSVKLIVYGLLGNEIKTLVNEKQTAGTYETKFDATTLASGVYYYKLITEGFVETKQMVLIK
jgi:hypothetical protein